MVFDLLELSEELAVAAQSDGDKSIIVAGQALAFWGDYYLDSRYPQAGRSALASIDIDFYERRIERVKTYIQAMQAVAKRHGAKLSPPHYPTMDDSTFSTAIMELKHQDLAKPITIDFIGQVAGLTDTEVERGADLVTVGSKAFPVLNPCLCLKARIYNLLHLYPRLGKSPERMEVEVQRVRVGIDIVRAYLVDMESRKDAATVKKFHRRVQSLLRMGRQSFIGQALYKRYRIQLHDVFKGVNIDERTVKLTIRPAVARTEQRYPLE